MAKKSLQKYMNSMAASEAWYVRTWRPIAAFIYLSICIFDFGVMPTIYEVYNEKMTPEKAVVIALKFKDSAAQVQAFQSMTTKRSWEPLTLKGSGLFHLAFGALLTGAAVTRGMEKTERTKMMSAFGDDDADDDTKDDDKKDSDKKKDDDDKKVATPPTPAAPATPVQTNTKPDNPDAK